MERLTDSTRSTDLEEKRASFRGLQRLQRWAAEDDDDLDREEQEDRQRRMSHFQAIPSVPPRDAASGVDHQSINACPAEKAREVTSTLDSSTQQVVECTQSSATASLGRPHAPAAVKGEEMAVDDTVIPDSGRPVSKTLRPPRRMPSTAGERSPCPRMGTRKRKRGGGPEVRPEAEQIFKGLVFYYIPDNDIAPARSLRIKKAQEYGARWARQVPTASHIVVDTGLDYSSVERVTSKAGLLGPPPKIVNENYPIDCIQFRSLLDHDQMKYRIPGQPAPVEAVDADKSVAPAAAVVDEAVGKAVRGMGRCDDVNDELSDCISRMQQFKHLPLDEGDDEDDHDDQGDSAAEGMDSDDGKRLDAEHESVDDLKAERARARLRSGHKGGKFEDRFACHLAGPKDAKADNPNSRTIEVLQSMADYYDGVDDRWRTLGYRKAISTLKRQEVKICTEEEAFRLPQIGRRIAQKIEEIVTTNRLRRLEYASDEATSAVLQLFLGIYGVGSKLAHQWIAQGHRTLDDLAAKAKLSPSQLVGIEHYDDLQTRIPRGEVEALGAVVKRAAAAIDPEVELIIGGSYRRGAESSRDIDFVVAKAGTASAAELRPFFDELVGQLEADGFLVACLASPRSASDGSKWHGCCVLPTTGACSGSMGGEGDGDAPEPNRRPLWRRIDFLLVPASEHGAALIYFTGNDIFNRSLRLLASKKGLKLNQHGLYRAGEIVEGRDERRIFAVLGVKWREPQERWC
ncbi:DNA-directed DNA polymerase X [Drechmeria coniospora]|uniref:DNA polymerase lambda n=1 Tax=Drechmeria coniospora TaxID=98403 RepID=A0A151GNE1_DRECN|nr:DNA-directed DNA polymerase X [Drechmeria coniospora]KYK58610.1 DNA-directed DNA polymerase X [Drechmeria coniospora]